MEWSMSVMQWLRRFVVVSSCQSRRNTRARWLGGLYAGAPPKRFSDTLPASTAAVLRRLAKDLWEPEDDGDLLSALGEASCYSVYFRLLEYKFDANAEIVGCGHAEINSAFIACSASTWLQICNQGSWCLLILGQLTCQHRDIYWCGTDY